MTTTENSADRGFLPLLFVGGMIATLLATVLSVLGISGGIAMLADRTFNIPMILGWLFGGLTSISALVIVGVSAAVFATIAVLLLNKAKKMIATQPDFMKTGVYRGALFVPTGILSLLTVAATSSAVAIAITSLLVIGGNHPVKNLYLDEFIPAVTAVILLGAVTWMLIGIAKNKKDFVKVLSATLIVISAAALVLGGVAVGVKSHSKSSGPSTNYPGYNNSSSGGSNSNKNSGSNSNSGAGGNNSNSSGSGSSSSGSGSNSGSGSSSSSGSSCEKERQAYIANSDDEDAFNAYYNCVMKQ